MSSTASQLLSQLADLMLEPVIQNALPIVSSALSTAAATPNLVENPVNLSLWGNQLVANLAATLPVIENTDVTALLQVSNAAVAALASKLSSAPVTASSVGAAVAAAISGAPATTQAPTTTTAAT
jgi:hypothetical protein